MYCVERTGSTGRLQIQAGYPGMNASANETSWAPFCAASAMYLQVFATDAWRSSHSGSICVAATRSLVNFGDIEASLIVMKRSEVARYIVNVFDSQTLCPNIGCLDLKDCGRSAQKEE